MHTNFSHKLTQYTALELQQTIDEIKSRLKTAISFRSGFSKDKLIQLVDELSGFDLGKFLLINCGIDGYWTDYIINLPRDDIKLLPKLEQALMQSNVLQATYQRQQIFKRENQSQVKNGHNLASIPSGLMSELLDLDYSQIENIHINACDLDPQAFIYSQQKYPGLYAKFNIQSLCVDALNLNIQNQYDLISSNGLSIYIKDDAQVLKLYQNFYQALKPGGKLVTSFLTYPRSAGSISEQQHPPANSDNLSLAIFGDILEVKWSCYRTSQQVSELVGLAGFKHIEIFGDENYIFPTLIAFKI